jgi:hypothetical protein
VYVATCLKNRTADTLLAIASLEEQGYHVHLQSPAIRLPREISAAVNYFIGMAATRTIGNSVSTFSALLLMERRQQSRWAAYYNGGRIPLERYFPLFKQQCHNGSSHISTGLGSMITCHKPL